jgi:hypothetical protein
MAVGQISVLIGLLSSISVQGEVTYTIFLLAYTHALVLEIILVIMRDLPDVSSARIIDYGASQNDTRINWDNALPLGSPYEPSLYFWSV